MKRAIHLLSGISVIASVVWLWFARDAETLQAVVGSIIAFWSSFSADSNESNDRRTSGDRKPKFRNAVSCAGSVLKTLAEAPGYGRTEEFIHREVNRMSSPGVPLQQVRDAIDRNHKQRLIRSETEEESGTVQWFITSAGIARIKQYSDQ